MDVEQHLESNAGTYGWAGLAAYVIAFDILSPQTLSTAVDCALEHPVMKYVAWGIGGIVTGHVMNIIPESYDPIQAVGDYVYDRWIA